MKVKNATVSRCGVCEAPYRKPLPEGWTLTSHKIAGMTYVQIHQPGCPMGFKPKTQESK